MALSETKGGKKARERARGDVGSGGGGARVLIVAGISAPRESKSGERISDSVNSAIEGVSCEFIQWDATLHRLVVCTGVHSTLDPGADVAIRRSQIAEQSDTGERGIRRGDTGYVYIHTIRLH